MTIKNAFHRDFVQPFSKEAQNLHRVMRKDSPQPRIVRRVEAVSTKQFGAYSTAKASPFAGLGANS